MTTERGAPASSGEGERAVELRSARPGDADVVSRIYIDSWNAGFGHLLGTRESTPDRTSRWRDDLASTTLEWTVASRHDQVVGFVGIGPSRDPVEPELGELHAIAVDPPHWRTHVGTALMDRALEQLGRRWGRAVLWTPAGYDRGHAFYRATGWRPLGRVRAGGTEVAFHRTLSS